MLFNRVMRMMWPLNGVPEGLRSRLKTLSVAAFERAYPLRHIQVSPQTLNRKASIMSTPRMQYATDLTDAQWQQIEPFAAGAALAVRRSGSAAAGSPPDRQRPFVFEQRRGVLGRCYLVVLGRGKRCMIIFVAGASTGFGRRC